MSERAGNPDGLATIVWTGLHCVSEPHSEAAPKAPHRARTCLIVDDSRVVRGIARKIMEQFGYAVGEAENGEEALGKCHTAMPHLILLDWNMPVMSGMEFLKLLRQRGHSDQPKVVFCTTENDMAHIMEAMNAGANEYIMKPFDSDIIQAKFSQVGLI